MTAAASPPPAETPHAVCQHCLADTCHTPIAFHLPMDKRCPVCGAAYTGPRRSAEYQLLLEAGFVAKGGE